jgi:hypothetical protein
MGSKVLADFIFKADLFVQAHATCPFASPRTSILPVTAAEMMYPRVDRARLRSRDVRLLIGPAATQARSFQLGDRRIVAMSCFSLMYNIEIQKTCISKRPIGFSRN